MALASRLRGVPRLEAAVLALVVLGVLAALVWASLFMPKTKTAEEACLRYVPPGTPVDIPRCPGSFGVYENTLRFLREEYGLPSEPYVVDSFCRIVEAFSGVPACAQGPAALREALQGFEVDVAILGGRNAVFVAIYGESRSTSGDRIYVFLYDGARAGGTFELLCTGETLRLYQPTTFIGGPLKMKDIETGPLELPFSGVVEDRSDFAEERLQLVFHPNKGSQLAAAATAVFEPPWSCRLEARDWGATFEFPVEGGP